MRGSIVKRPSGVYGIRYYGPDGRRRYETVGPNRKDAEKRLTQRLRELDSGAWREPSRQTLEHYAASWLERQDPDRTVETQPGRRFTRRRIARSTFETYQRDLRRHVLPRLGGLPLAAITGQHVDRLIHELETAGKAPEGIRNVVIPLRKLLGDAVRQGLIPANPASRCDLPPAQDFVGVEIPPVHVAAIREALEELAPGDPLRPGERDLFGPHLVDVALGTGLRVGELQALAWGDVDRERRVIRVQRALSGGEISRPKSKAGIRAVPLFPSVDTALRALEARARFGQRPFGPEALVFGNELGRPFDDSNFRNRTWKPALRLAGLEERGYRLHDLRHTCVSRLVAEGADVALVQAVAGHSDPRMTLQRYAHLREQRVSEAAARFDPGAVRALHGH